MKNWIKDIVTILIAAMIWWFTPVLTRAIDPTAGVDDAGMLQRISFALVSFLIFHAFTKIFMRLFWPTLDGYLATNFNWDFINDNETSWRRYFLSSLFYLLVMLALAILF